MKAVPATDLTPGKTYLYVRGDGEDDVLLLHLARYEYGAYSGILRLGAYMLILDGQINSKEAGQDVYVHGIAHCLVAYE